ncbi:MAG: RHS repeat protein [Thermoanaerobaculia bacterium]|nr:RHS repeat protein [Thermoanaerobaculia bacterium]
MESLLSGDHPCRRYPWAAGLWLIFLFLPAALAAQLCTSSTTGVTLGFDVGPDLADPNANCLNFLWCYTPQISGSTIEMRPIGCDPSLGSCSARVNVPVRFPGLDNNSVVGNSPGRITWNFTTGGGFVGGCGTPGAALVWDQGTAWLSVGGFRCDPLPSSSLFAGYKMTAQACAGATGCPQPTAMTDVDLSPGLLSALFCPPEPPPWSCGEPGRNTCSLCTGPSGGTPISGGGPAFGGPGFGGGAYFYYLAGGVGHPAHPRPAGWSTRMGRFWAHSYSETLVLDPDESHVWALTAWASFREFTDDDGDGFYETVVPSDEYRELHKTITGFELRDLDGTVKTFDDAGVWVGTRDRHNNETTPTYVAGVLTAVSFADQREEHFTYHPSGKLASVVEIGVDGTTSRTWGLTWVSDDLVRLDRPDGTAWIMTFGDVRFPGYITRLELLGTSGGMRVEEAWEYDATGKVVRNWRGDPSFTGPNAVAKTSLSFDDPLQPTETTVTDALGKVSLYTIERDPASVKPRLIQLSGGCPACGVGPNSQLFYDDPAHPLLPTRVIDGRGVTTAFDYDARGELVSRVEALGRPLERETRFQRHSDFPALVTEVEQPSTSGNPMEFRRTIRGYDPAGNEETLTLEGFEDGLPFSFQTVQTWNGAGRLLTTDPPGHGADDRTVYTYDSGRGELVPLTRMDPLVGTTTFSHDPFNRLVTTVDPNGAIVETVFDALNRVRFTIERGTVPAEDRIHERIYDQFGDLVLEILPRGNAIAYERDASGRVFAIERKPDADPSSHGERTFYILDGAGQVTREELQSWTGASWQTASAREYVRTSACQVDKVILGAGSATPSITEQKFDCNGSVLAEWDGNHPSMSQTAPPSRSYVYDDLNRPSSVTQPWGGAGGGSVTETYEYDVQGHRTRLIDGEGNTTRQVWSDRDLVTEEVSEVSGTVTYTYDEHGELETSTDARGVTTERVLDAADRVTLVDYPDDSLDVSFTYDDPLVPFSKGRLTKIERAGHEIPYEWDVFGQMTRDGELTYLHDANGNREEIGYPGGVSARYTFDFSDREGTLEVAVPGEPVQPVVTASSYLPLGPLAWLALGNGLTETRTHDARYYPDRITVAGTTPLLDWDYTVDAVGNPTAITDLLSPSGSRVYAYQDYQYFLTLGNGPWGNLSWAYDKIGGRTRETHGGVADLYSYVPNMAGGHSPKLDEITLGAGGTKVYGFDAAGNQTQVAAGADVIDMVYDDASQLASFARLSAGVRSEMLYDGRGFLRHAEEIRPDLIFEDGFETGGGACWSAVVGGVSGGVSCRAARWWSRFTARRACCITS